MENKKKDNPLKEIKELADALRKTREKVSEPLKPVVKLQETILKINKQNEEFQKFSKNLNPLLNPFAPFVPKAGLLGTIKRPPKATGIMSLLGSADTNKISILAGKYTSRNKPIKAVREPSVIGMGLRSYMKKNNLKNPVEIARAFKKHKGYEVYGFMGLRHLCEEMNVNPNEAFLYICEGMTSTEKRWQKHRMDKEFWRGSESIVNLVRYFKDKNKAQQSRGLPKYTVKQLHKSDYVARIFKDNDAKVGDYTTFSRWFKTYKYHCETLKLV